MPIQYQVKRSSVAGRVPDAANVAVGELAVNLADQQLYTKDGSGNIFLLGAGNTDRLIEGTANLFYTNVRVYGNVTNLLPNYTGNLSVGNIIGLPNTDLAIIDGNARITFNSQTGNISIPVGLVTNVVSANIWQGLYSSNVIENTNLYFTNARARSSLSAGTGVTYNASTGQISIGQNVAAVDSPTFFNLTVSGNLTVVGNTTTINSTSFEVDDPLIYLAGNNYFSDVVDIGFVGNYYDGNLQRHAGLFRDATDGNFKLFDNLNPEPINVIDTANSTFRYSSLYLNNLYGNVIGTVSTLSNFSTSNLTEGTNLYYSNARVYSNIAPLLTTANLTEVNNLYYTNARVYANVNQIGYAYIAQVATKANIIDLTTANVTELTNLYYTNTRVYANVISLLPYYTGNVSANNLIGLASNTTIIAGPYSFAFLNSGELQLPSIRANVLYANIIQGATTSNITEGTNLYYNNTRVYGNVSQIGYAFISQVTSKANVVDLTTANVTELNNLYFTNARVNVAISSQLLGNASFSGIIQTNNIIKSNQSAGDEGGEFQLAIPQSNTSLSGPIAIDVYQNKLRFFETTGTNRGAYIDLTAATAGVGSNLLAGGGGGGSGTITFVAGVASGSVSNAQLATAIVTSGLLTTANVTETTNLYFSNARVYANVNQIGYAYIAQVAAKANIVDLTTANVTETTNLYYTNTRVYANVISLLPNYRGNIGGNLIGTDSNTTIIAGSYSFAFLNNGEVQVPYLRANVIYANVIQGATTSNISEGSNLYYTNARVSGQIALANIADLLDVGANVPAVGQSLVWTGSLWQPGNVATSGANVILVGQQTAINYVANGTINTFALGFTPVNPTNILVFVDGVAQNYPNNYTVSGTSLIFDENPSANSVVSVKYFDADRIYNARFFLGTTTNENFVANGTGNTYTIVANSPDPNQTFVFVNGIIQVPNVHYSLANSIISFDGIPDNGSNIFVRTFSNSQAEVLLGQLKNVSNAAPTTGQSLIWNGSNWTPGTPTSNVSIYQRYTFVAANAQTNFSGLDNNSQLLFIPNSSRAEVFLNGVLLERTLDYTANSTSVVLGLGADLGDILTVANYVDIGPGFTIDSFTGNGSNTQFSLSRTPGSGASLLITLDGLKQHQSEFSLNGTTLTFTEAPAANVAIEVTHMGNAPIAVANELWAEISGVATAIPGYKYIVNTAASAAFISLPPNPRLGDSVWFLDGTSSFDTNKLTILRNGSRIMGQLDDFISDIEDSYFGFVYFNSNYGWRLLN